MAMNNGTDLPRWKLDNLYEGFFSEKYTGNKESLKTQIGIFLEIIGDDAERETSPENWLKECIKLHNKVNALHEDLTAFTYAEFSTNTRNKEAARELSVLEEIALPLKKADVLFRNKLAGIKDTALRLVKTDPELSEYGFFISEQLFLQQKQMTPELENMAADLSRSGGDAWGKLHEAVTSTASILWDDGTNETKTVTELRTLAHSGDRAVREKAFRKELEIWKNSEIPLSYALNGVKGFSISLNKRRNYKDSLERSLYQARISQKTLDSLIEAMEKSLPMFRKYLRGKAKVLGQEKLAFYDLFAPVGKSVKKWSFNESRDFILEKFNTFSAEMGDFAGKAFENGWIDAQPREGKVGGAYCMGFPLTKESRILCNFGGSFSDLSTVAHELGHGYHHFLLKDQPVIHQNYPMTLAETASIFSETIIFNSALDTCTPEEKLPLLEVYLQDTTQVIVDILSRFYFEKDVFKNRKKGDLNADEFSELMLSAQKKTYGDALLETELHPYMWAVKGHYYIQDLAFYNFPYSFGQLFGLGLYSQYKTAGNTFTDKYRSLLKQTGKASAVEVCRSAGFDIETPDFWQAGIDTIGKKVEEFIALIE